RVRSGLHSGGGGLLLTRPSYLGIVPARGGSKGIPRKNMVELGGKPLVQHSIEAGLGSSRLDLLLLSSEDREILELAMELGCAVVERPSALARDEAATIDVVIHALDHAEGDHGLRPDAVVLLQPTSPFRTAADIDGAIDA